jgi:hypothetical protein
MALTVSYRRGWRGGPTGAHPFAMLSPQAAAEGLPAIYRSILALVDELERCDGRVEAGVIRAAALSAYASAWDARHRRQLEQLEERLRRAIALRQASPHG